MRSDLQELQLQASGVVTSALYTIAAEVGDEATETFAAWSWCRPRGAGQTNGYAVGTPWLYAVCFCSSWDVWEGETVPRRTGAWDQRRSGRPARRRRARQAAWIC